MSIMVNDVGTPIISKYGKFNLIEEYESFKQRLWNLFNTQLGSVDLFPNYGFDVLSLVTVNPADIERALYSNTVNALNPENVEGLYEVNDITVSYSNGKGYISMELLTIYGSIYKSRIEVAL